ncbi:MAG: N-acetyltransferase [Tyzzerella sp.]|nr:N-acetyltransferase [Tyzzerella sp.]
MKIIKCEMKHLDALTKLYDKVTEYLVSHINYPKWTPGVYPGRESIREAIEKGIQYACFDVDKAVGAFILNEDPQGAYSEGEWVTDAEEGEFLVIHTLASDPECYGKGTGKRMVDFCIETAKECQKKAVRLDVVPDNIPARKLYEKMGFVFAGEKDLKRGIEEIPTFVLYEYPVKK